MRNDLVVACDARSQRSIQVGRAAEARYRGHVPVELARTLGGEIDPVKLAAAAKSGNHDPQAIKWLWHCLAGSGRKVSDHRDDEPPVPGPTDSDVL